MVLETRIKASIHHRNFRAGILQTILKLLARPPRVEWRDDGTCQRRAVERHRPFGQIAHDDRHAITLGDALGNQVMGKCDRGARKALVGRAVIVKHQKCLVTMRPTDQKRIADSRRGVLPDTDFLAVNDRLVHFKHDAGGREKSMRLGNGHRGPRGFGAVGCRHGLKASLADFVSRLVGRMSARHRIAQEKRRVTRGQMHCLTPRRVSRTQL